MFLLCHQRADRQRATISIIHIPSIAASSMWCRGGTCKSLLGRAKQLDPWDDLECPGPIQVFPSYGQQHTGVRREQCARSS